MKRASSVRKTGSAAPGAKRPRRRPLKGATQPASASSRPKTNPKSKQVAPRQRQSAGKTTPLAGPAKRKTKRVAAARRRPVAKGKAKPSLRPAAKTKIVVRRTRAKASPIRQPRPKIPAYLLEGDVPVAATAAGPGEKFALGPDSPAAHFPAEAAHLPEAYGTGRLHVTARDPHWLYAHWDIAPRDQFRHNARSVDRHLILRIHEGEVREQPVAEIHVHPESRHWFAHVERAATAYVTELGYYQPGRRWKSLARSAPAKTPPDYTSSDATVEFATIPLELSFKTLRGMLPEGAAEKLPLARAIDQLRVSRRSSLYPLPATAAWPPEKEQAFAEYLARYQAAPGAPSSPAVHEPSGGQGEGEQASLPAGALEPSSFFWGAEVTSPFGGGPSGGKDFWLHVNAELIIYGATQPDASVSLGGKRIAVRPDGSFGFRFALPDGQYALPIVAVSADNTDGRAAELKFTRATEYVGAGEAPPPDPALMPPPQNG